MRGIFVTGTDTGIGKTIVSAALINGLRGKENICYWKPIQTGIEDDNDTLRVKELANCTDEELHDEGIRLEKPLSPHLSAKLANLEISIKQILSFVSSQSDEKFWIVEGAGGVLVPLNDKEFMIDFIARLGLSVLVVSRSGLGTINHTLLTIEALRKRDLEVLGVVLNGEPNVENKKAVEHCGKIPVLAEMPKFEKLSFEVLNDWSKKNIDIWRL